MKKRGEYECLSVFDHFVGFALKRLSLTSPRSLEKLLIKTMFLK